MDSDGLTETEVVPLTSPTPLSIEIESAPRMFHESVVLCPPIIDELSEEKDATRGPPRPNADLSLSKLLNTVDASRA